MSVREAFLFPLLIVIRTFETPNSDILDKHLPNNEKASWASLLFENAFYTQFIKICFHVFSQLAGQYIIPTVKEIFRTLVQFPLIRDLNFINIGNLHIIVCSKVSLDKDYIQILL